ncbi:Flp pilus assembly complex ATPase component TadA [Halorussus gelatinilyticus]|uniref:Flp pilus assembly complex ATPase component TadA n=1 Tax=Halorussus gelatinilyticus TaxID=2937524 RepID=A0A8U0IE58_9EURY|nr:ATPase, T2SS/T4P/T4SS family [Halorussus gelatinilyticus]UPV99349.1 Flp pilus assembly complex ATPase component TadA [Halorussus gelatinilyticus]
MRNPLARFRDDDPDCACDPRFEDDRLLLDAAACPGAGDLATEPACRGTAISALADREAESVVTRTDRIERAYEGASAALLVAAGRFAERVAFYDSTLADRAETDPLAAARAALGRAGPVGDIVAETGLAECARRVEGDADALRPFAGPPVAKARVAADPPPDATLAETRDLATGATVRIYADERALRTYHLEPVEHDFDAAALDALADAYGLLADGEVSEETAAGERAPGRAVREVADPEAPVEALAAALRKHTRGYGVLADFFADPRVSDVFATAPVGRNPLRVAVDGERMRTNVRLTEEGARALASRFRRESGRAFSRAAPTLDATAEIGAGASDPNAPDPGAVRVAGVTDPVSDGPGFAFRARDATPWTLPALVANDTLPADAAALLSLATERAAAGLVAGPRGAGKTTLLGALCWELPAATRTVVIEDTPELPVSALQRGGRDVQPLRTTTDDGPGLAPADALRTALRLGEGALVVGEVRGEEAAVLYEAMRVGANGDAVLGTIHGDGGAGVRERVVSDLAVPASSFATTDLVVTLEAVSTPAGKRRRVKAVQEVRGDGGDRFEALFEIRTDELAPTGRIDRGNSALVAALAESGESYADVCDALADRESLLAECARRDRTEPEAVVSTYADRRAS